ncbi:hypothetical protein [Streptacidiphilus monticola]|uniref:Uncharacterized protein n=1 Tax=Streptacidiphilus monticola TaxID=2161674 RepID=A0ABW1GC96_9ACTN
MGAVTFYLTATATTPQAAFDAIRQEAAAEYGWREDSGTVAMKDEYVLIDTSVRPHDEAMSLAVDLIARNDPRVEDSFGPAGCLEITPTTPGGGRAFLFFGWAND